MDAVFGSPALLGAVASGFLLFAGGFWVIVALGHWSLAPLEQPAIAAPVPTQFSLGEFSLLALKAQLVTVLLAWACGGELTMTLLLGAVVGGGLIVMWLRGVRQLARCGVHSSVRRNTFLLVVTPLTCGAIFTAFWINGRAVLDTCLGTTFNIPLWLVSNLIIAGVFVLSRILTVWVLTGPPPIERETCLDEGIRYVSTF